MIAGKYYEPGDAVRVRRSGAFGDIVETHIARNGTYYLVKMDNGQVNSYGHDLLEPAMAKGEAIKCPNCNQEFGR